MQRSAISFKSGDLTLEGMVARPKAEGDPVPIVVLCHTHPAMAGTMTHPLLEAMSRALAATGIATFRFNFRGIGGSEGAFSNGEEEAADITAALQVAGRWPGTRRGRVGLVGHSFGAGVALRGLAARKGVRAEVLVAPPPAAISPERLEKDPTPKLFLVGEADRIAPPARLRELLASCGERVQLQVVPGANHTWRGAEEEAARLCSEFLARHLI
ncbi:MAG: alpha/beta fold hydrolase [Dehalococcoidia bacterium]|nr:alpha/beta fold hydrolase [Dehalococcoidia bacterium]